MLRCCLVAVSLSTPWLWGCATPPATTPAPPTQTPAALPASGTEPTEVEPEVPEVEPQASPQGSPPVAHASADRGIAIRWLGEEGATDDAPQVDDGVLLAALPKDARMQLAEDGRVQPEFWTRLDPEGRSFLTQIRWGAVESSLLVVTAKGKVTGKLTLRDRVPDVGVVDVLGDERQEIVIESILGNALSAYPTIWQVHQVDSRGRLKAVATMAHSNGQGSKCVEYFFVNRITVPEKGIFRVENINFDGPGANSPPKSPQIAGESYELRWNTTAGKFERQLLPARELEPVRRPCGADEHTDRRIFDL